MLHSIWFEQNVRTRKDNDETKSKRDQSETLKENNKVEQEDDESKPCDHEGFLQPGDQRDLAQKLQKFSMAFRCLSMKDVGDGGDDYNGGWLSLIIGDVDDNLNFDDDDDVTVDDDE